MLNLNSWSKARDHIYALRLIPRPLPRRFLIEVALPKSSRGDIYLPHLA